jgi:hypothetical protein
MFPLKRDKKETLGTVCSSLLTFPFGSVLGDELRTMEGEKGSYEG